MSFKLFIYYCALCGAWAALVVWVQVIAVGLHEEQAEQSRLLLNSALTGAALGLQLGLVVGILDALLNSVGYQRVLRPLVCAAVGMGGGLFGALVGEAGYQYLSLPKFLGWMLVGTAIGVSVGVFDLFRALAVRRGTGLALRKTVNGLIGGLIGGLVGGMLFALLTSPSFLSLVPMPRGSLALGLVILGSSIGLLIGTAQVVLKEAWVRVEAGFRPGRELILSKAETTIGRAEDCDIGLFGDSGIERLHARIVLEGNRYLLADAGTPGGTFLNGERITGPTPLRSGDRIGMGKAILRFGERQKR
ncbi:MAG TPA: FHA domain-containing protein [Gemmataceae bacterium]|nr:FHA domain-containing protein [Gemmataceae bacterium]